MENKNSINAASELINKNIERIRTLEKFSIFIFIIGLTLYILKQTNMNFILIIGSVLIAIINFLFAYSSIGVENLETTNILNSIGFINFIYKLTYFSISIASIAMLGLVLKLNNNIAMMNMSGFTLLVVLILSLITRLNDRSMIYNGKFYIRIVICLVCLGYLAFIKYNIK